jgi:hypothetical protein
MRDYATSVYEKKKNNMIASQRSRFNFQTVATNHYSSGIINRKGQENQSTSACFSHYFLTQIEPFLPTSFLMPIIKKRQGREKMVSHLCISDLKLAKKKYFTAESGVLLYEEAILTGLTIHTTPLEDALFCNARLRTYEI